MLEDLEERLLGGFEKHGGNLMCRQSKSAMHLTQQQLSNGKLDETGKTTRSKQPEVCRRIHLEYC